MANSLQNVRRYFPKVNTVRDAKESIAIEVTPRDASESKRKKHSECAMAVALKRDRPQKARRIGARKNRYGSGDPAKHPGTGDPLMMKHATEGIREVLGFEGQ